jgi:hypothetical protein
LTTPLSPPQPALPGQPYVASFTFRSYETGALTDPDLLQIEFTYGTALGTVDAISVAGPFEYQGDSSETPGVLWRTGTGAYSFWWDVPGSALTGAYVANWTATYGADTILTVENFAVLAGGPFVAIPSGDVGYWTGSVTYSPSWSPQPLSVQFGATDGNGVTWLWQSITGWDSPPSAGQVVQRSADHGGWPAPQYFGPRIITLTVMASAPTQALRDQARAVLQQVFPVGDLAVLQYDEPVPKLAYVRRNASAAITESCPTLCDVVFTIPLVAPDPRKYAITPQTVSLVVPPPIVNPLALPFSLPVSFPGNIPPSDTSVTALNVGNFESRPQITVTGPITSPAIVNAATGQQVTFTGLTLNGTDQLTLDMDNRQSFLNGSTFYAADVSSSWWVLFPGSTDVYLDGVTTGGATLSLSFQSSWI